MHNAHCTLAYAHCTLTYAHSHSNFDTDNTPYASRHTCNYRLSGILILGFDGYTRLTERVIVTGSPGDTQLTKPHKISFSESFCAGVCQGCVPCEIKPFLLSHVAGAVYNYILLIITRAYVYIYAGVSREALILIVLQCIWPVYNIDLFFITCLKLMIFYYVNLQPIDLV